MSETWRPIVGAPGYEISTAGRARSMSRVVRRRNRWGGENNHRVRERVLKCGCRSGYPIFAAHVGDQQITLYIHEQVMAAFGPPRPFAGALIRHLDDIRSNCQVGNLAWGTQRDNMADAKRNGRTLGGYRLKGSRVAA